MTDTVKGLQLLESLTDLPDERLWAVIDRARKLLQGREVERQERALAEVKRIIRESRLQVTVRKSGKPGRPRKSKEAS